jgi:phosphoserine phosphatase RsbU/P
MGFFEWENKKGEQFGTDRLANVIQQFADRQPEEIIAELYASVLEFVDGASQQDDLTAVLIKHSAAGAIGDAPSPVSKVLTVAA